jgi:purine-nucleoside phosphorylase
VKNRNVDGADPVAPEHVHHESPSQAINGVAKCSGSDQAEGNYLQAWHVCCSHYPGKNADSGQQTQHDQDWSCAREQAPGGPNIRGVNQREESRHDVNGLIPLVAAWDVGDRPGFECLVQSNPNGNDQQWQKFHGSSIGRDAEDWIVRTHVRDELETRYDTGMIDSIADRIASSLTVIRAKTNFKPEIAIILGSGLGPLADEIDLEASIPFADLPGFPVSTAPGHVGRVVLGTLEGRPVIAFQGRVHLYEGYSAQEVVLPVRLAHALGARVLVVSNACGGLNPAWNAGDIMLQSDYINFTGANPLIGPNDPSVGVRFVPMMDAYDPKYLEIARTTARALDMELREGVYLGISGPTYAPKAELRMFRNLGADAIGMSTVLEVIAARHQEMRVIGLSSVTDMAVADQGDHSGTTEQAVIEQAKRSGPRFQQLVRAILPQL